MTISGTTRLAFLPFRTAVDPLPAGLWTSQATLIMDASGGEAIITHEVVLLSEPFSALMLTLEQLTLDDARTTEQNWLLEAIGFEEHNVVGNNNVIIALRSRPTVGTVTALEPPDMLQKPLFLGRCDRTSGQDSAISIRTDNTNGFSIRDSLWGYYWTPGAMNAVGGPQRPPGPLFGR